MWVEGGVGMERRATGARSETIAIAEAEGPTGGEAGVVLLHFIYYFLMDFFRHLCTQFIILV
jgi:hypothetical protein